MKKLLNVLKYYLNFSYNNEILDLKDCLDFEHFSKILLNNKSYLIFQKNNSNEFLPDNYRNLFTDKIEKTLDSLNIEEEDNKKLILILEKKEKNDIFLLWIYYSKIFIPILKQQKKDVLFIKKNNNLYNIEKLNNNSKRYFFYSNDFLENQKIDSESKNSYFINNKTGVFDFLLFKQAVYLHDYSFDSILGTHKILIDITTDNVVAESLEKYSRDDIRIRSFNEENSNLNQNIRLLLRKLVKQSINFSEKKQIEEYFLEKIKKLNSRRQKLMFYYLKNQKENYKSKVYFDYVNNLVFVIGKKIKILFLVRQIYFSKNFSQNYKYLLILRKKLLYLIKEEKLLRKKMLLLKNRKQRLKVRNIIEKDDFFFYKRRSNFLKFCNIMYKKKKGKFSKFSFSSITDFSVFVDVDGSKYFNSYLKYPFKNTSEEEVDLNDFFKESSYNLNYLDISECTEIEVLNYYKQKNPKVNEFLKGLNDYKYTTYNYALPTKMEGDVLEFEGLSRKFLFENRKTKKSMENLNEYFQKIVNNFNIYDNENSSLIFDTNEYVFNVLYKNKSNMLTFSNKDFSLDEKTSMFFEFFLFGHLMFKFIGLNQKFNFHFCFNFLSKNYFDNNEFNSTLKNNTLVSRYSKNKHRIKTQYLILIKNKIWFYFPVISKFYYTYIISFFRFVFSGILTSFFIKKNVIFYFICKIYLFFIDTYIAQLIFLVPIGFIKEEIFKKIVKKLIQITNFPYNYDEFIKFSYRIQMYMRIPGYTFSDINNFISYYIASPYVYYYEKFIKFIVENFFVILDFIIKMIS